MNGVELVTSAQSPSTKTFALVNPNDQSQYPNNVDVVPAGTGPSNASGTATADPYIVQISP